MVINLLSVKWDYLDHFGNGTAQFHDRGRKLVQLFFDAGEQVKTHHYRETNVCNQGDQFLYPMESPLS
jgi:hypothetical protein